MTTTLTPADAVAALNDLDAHLAPRDFSTTLFAGDATQPPRLTVVNRHTQLCEDIYAGDDCYYWPWAQPIAAVGNPQAAAAKVSYVLGAAAGLCHG